MSPSGAWKYFQKVNSEKAKCKTCGNSISIKGGSTGGLLKHMRKVHSIICVSGPAPAPVPVVSSNNRPPAPSTSTNSGNKRKRDEDDDDDAVTQKKRKKKHGSNEFVGRQTELTFTPVIHRTLPEIVSRLAAVDGLSVNAICRSEFIRHALKKEGMNLPKSPTSVMDMIGQFADVCRENVISELRRRVDRGERFSVTADEWTSNANKRFLNVNLRSKDSEVFVLGLVRITGTFTSERTLEAINDHLEKFGIDMERHCVCDVTDGASVMTKFGRLSTNEFQACYQHAIHLAVCDVLYSKKKDNANTTAENETDNNDGDDDNEEQQDEDTEDYEVAASTESTNDNYALDETERIDLNDDIKHIIKSVRKDVKRFRKRCKENEKLQEYVKKEHEKPLNLLLDVKTRWNSLEAMTARYVKLRGCLKKAFIDLKERSNVSDTEFQNVKDLAAALTPIKLTSEALGRKDATLLSADGALKFLIKQLKSMDKTKNMLSKKLLDRLEVRISERRNVALVSLLQYLHNPDFADVVGEGVFRKVSKLNMHKLAVSLLTRLQQKPIPAIVPEEEAEEDDVVITEGDDGNESDDTDIYEFEEKTLAQQLEESIDSCLKESDTPDEVKSLSADFKLFEQSRKRTENLKFLYDALLTIPPSSVEAERAFSTAGNFATKIRSRLADRSLCNLVFLKKYFLIVDRK